MSELNLQQMAKISGGAERKVNTGVDGLDAAFRAEPRKGSKQIGHFPNGTVVSVISDKLAFDPESGRNFVEVKVGDKTGWIAASILGFPR